MNRGRSSGLGADDFGFDGIRGRMYAYTLFDCDMRVDLVFERQSSPI